MFHWKALGISPAILAATSSSLCREGGRCPRDRATNRRTPSRSPRLPRTRMGIPFADSGTGQPAWQGCRVRGRRYPPGCRWVAPSAPQGCTGVAPAGHPCFTLGLKPQPKRRFSRLLGNRGLCCEGCSGTREVLRTESYQVIQNSCKSLY